MTTTVVSTPARSGQGPRWDQPVRLTALYHEHRRRGAAFIEREGWLLPASYGDTDAERSVIQSGAGLCDVSESDVIDVKSTELEDAFTAAFPGIDTAATGQTVSIGDGEARRVLRLTNDEAYVLTAPGQVAETLRALEEAAAGRACTHVTDLSGAFSGLRLLGPHAPAVLELLSSLDLAPDRFADGALAQGGVARVPTLIVRRDAQGLPGYELYVDRDLGAYLWESLLEAGAPLGLQPVGRDAVEEG